MKKEERKQETLEEASLLSRPIHLIWDEDERYDCNEEFREEFKKGAKWQEQQTIKEVFEWLTTNNYLTDLKETLIKNFKNK